MIVRDLIEAHGRSGLQSALLQGRLIAYDGKDGKKLFDTRINKPDHVKQYYNARVSAMWSEILIDAKGGYSNYATPVTKVYLEHYTLHDERERPTAIPFEFLDNHMPKTHSGEDMFTTANLACYTVSMIEDYLESLGFKDVSFVTEMTGKTKEEIEKEG